MVLVIIIVVAWAVILGPSLLKRRARAGAATSRSPTSTTSCGSSSTPLPSRSSPPPTGCGPSTARDARRASTYPDTGTPPKLTVVGAKELPRPALAFLGEPGRSAADPAADRRRPDACRSRPTARRPPRAAGGRVRTPGPPGVSTGLRPGRTARRRRDGPRRGPPSSACTLVPAVFCSRSAGRGPGAHWRCGRCVPRRAWPWPCTSPAGAPAPYGHGTGAQAALPRARGGARPSVPAASPTQVSGRYAHPSNQQADRPLTAAAADRRARARW